MAAEIFVDVIGGISVNAGLVRIELISRQSVDGEASSRAELCQRLIMPVQGFIDAFAALTALAETQFSSHSSQPVMAVLDDSRPPQSPNFH